jgi:hypothetical protein
LQIEELLWNAAGVSACYYDEVSGGQVRRARNDGPIIVCGASMPMAPNSANVGMGSWVDANALGIVSDVLDNERSGRSGRTCCAQGARRLLLLWVLPL